MGRPLCVRKSYTLLVSVLFPRSRKMQTQIRDYAAPLAAARAAYKEHIGAPHRSQRFTHSMLQKIDVLCEDLMSCSTSCGSASPSVICSMSCGSASPRGSP